MTLRQDWTNTCVLEPCKNDASEREERKSPNPGKRSAKRSVRVYAANCDCVTCLSKSLNISRIFVLCFPGNGDHKKFTKNPRPFSKPNPQANTKNYSQNLLERANKVKH